MSYSFLSVVGCGPASEPEVRHHTRPQDEDWFAPPSAPPPAPPPDGARAVEMKTSGDAHVSVDVGATEADSKYDGAVTDVPLLGSDRRLERMVSFHPARGSLALLRHLAAQPEHRRDRFIYVTLVGDVVCFGWGLGQIDLGRTVANDSSSHFDDVRRKLVGVKVLVWVVQVGL